MAVINTVSVRHVILPLAEVLADAKHGDHTHFELILVTVTDADGVSGTGYTYTGGRGGSAIAAMLEQDIKPFLLGRDAADIEAVYDGLQWHMHYVGRGGILSFAVSAVDIALWDLRGKATDQPLWVMAGGSAQQCQAYRGGIDLNFPLPKLLDAIRGYLDDGYRAVKIKIGQPSLDDDLARIQAVRELVGADVTFMVDANYAFSVDEAIVAAKAFEPFDIYWFEEPTIPDDYQGYGRIAASTSIPLAMGENLHTEHEFGYALAQSDLGFIQPDASNCGGITGWLRAADMAADVAGEQQISVCSHGAQELHMSLVSGHPAGQWIEVHSFPIDQYTHRPVTVQNSRALAPDVPGIGVEFDWTKLEQHNVNRG